MRLGDDLGNSSERLNQILHADHHGGGVVACNLLEEPSVGFTESDCDGVDAVLVARLCALDGLWLMVPDPVSEHDGEPWSGQSAHQTAGVVEGVGAIPAPE